MKLLLVEDEPRMAEALTELLRQEGYDVDSFSRGDDGFLALGSGQYDGVILDVMLSGMSGLAIATESRRAGIRTPILMLTARSELDDKVAGLDAGADGYLTKPFQPRELLARVRALCRRGLPSSDDQLRFGDLALEMRSLTLHCGVTGQSVRLGEKECRILEYLIANQGKILTKEQLAVKIWGNEDDAEYNKVEVYISFTRKNWLLSAPVWRSRPFAVSAMNLRWEHE